MGGHTYEYSNVLIMEIRIYIQTHMHTQQQRQQRIYRSKNVLDSGLLLKLEIFRLTIGKCRHYYPSWSNSRDSKFRSY